MKISVIMTSYNYAQYLDEAINSIIAQTYPDWELIIVDDGSKDNSVELIKSYCAKDERIKLYTHENCANKGLKESILLALEHTQGDWVAFLESDDFLEPNYLLKKCEIIENEPSVSLIFNKVKFVCEGKQTRSKAFVDTQATLAKMIFPRNMARDFFINNMILTFSCVMVSKEALLDADFNTPVDAFLDWWLWISLAQEHEFYYVKEELTNWRLHKTSYVHRGKKPLFNLVQVQAYRKIYAKNKSLGLFLFIFFSSIKLFFVRAYRFLRRVAGRLKNL